MFLNSHAHTLHAVSAPDAGARAARAAQLHVRVSELDSIDRAAAMFSSQEESLREEALRYVRRWMGRIRLTIPLSFIPSRCEGRRWHQMRLTQFTRNFHPRVTPGYNGTSNLNSAAEFIN